MNKINNMNLHIINIIINNIVILSFGLVLDDVVGLRLSHPLFSSLQVWSETIANIKAANTYKRERVITSSQSAQITVAESEKPVLNFCANNYLGLANNPEVNPLSFQFSSLRISILSPVHIPPFPSVG